MPCGGGGGGGDLGGEPVLFHSFHAHLLINKLEQLYNRLQVNVPFASLEINLNDSRVSEGRLAVEASSDKFKEDLFAETSAIQDALDHTISSHTVVTVECKQKRVTNVHVLCLFWYK